MNSFDSDTVIFYILCFMGEIQNAQKDALLNHCNCFYWGYCLGIQSKHLNLVLTKDDEFS